MKKEDEHDWNTYSKDFYLFQLKHYYQDHFISSDGLYYSENGIEFKNNIHPNCKELYSIVYKLQPKSILECGCGACVDLKNLGIILPESDIYGIDISKDQLDIKNWYTLLPEKIDKNVCVMDITKETPNRKFDFVFCNAVIMHLSTDNAIKALNNMKNISNKYVFLVENPNSHLEWEKMVKEVFNDWEMSHSERFISHGILLSKI